VDRERGAELIRSAASSGLEEAMESLMNMYLTGKGVARDGKEAARWKEKLNEALYLKVSRGAENVKNTQDAIKNEAASRSGASTMEELEVSYQRTRSLRFLRSNVEAIIKNWYEEQLELSKMYFAAGDSGNGERVILETLKFAKDNKEYFPISLAPKGMIGDENSNIDTSYYDLNIMLVDCFIKAQRLEFAHEHLKKTKEWLDRIQANSTQKNIKIIKYSLEAKLAEVLYSMGDFEEAYRIISASATEYVEFIRESVVKGKVEAVNELQIIKGEAIEFIAAVDELYAVLCGQFALLGEVTLKLKKYGEAKNAFNEAAAANERAGRKKKKSIEVRCRLDMIDALIGLNEDTEECFRQAERAIAFLDEDTIEVSFLKAKILLKRGDVAAQKNKAEAKAYYQMALAIAQRLEKDAPSKEHIELLNELKEKD
jgi:tetratricopeptide (TPR) repeat protein